MIKTEKMIESKRINLFNESNHKAKAKSNFSLHVR